MEKHTFLNLYFLIIFFCLFAVILLSIPPGKILTFYLSFNTSKLTAKSLNGNQSYSKVSSDEPIKIPTGKVKFYEPTLNRAYHYEYRYHLNTKNISSNESRLIILLTGLHRSCIDWWTLSTGKKILSPMHSSAFSILAICTSRKNYAVKMPIQNNSDVYWIYTTLQTWMNEIYYPQFKHYPRLYLYGVSQGSRMAALLCRVLPIQAQILYLYPGYSPALMIHSDYTKDMQNRLKADFTFANWFYFDYCSKKHFDTKKQCPFRRPDKNYFNAVPPTYFVHAKHDSTLSLTNYIQIIQDLRKNAVKLNDTFLQYNDAIKLHVVSRVNITLNNIKENFDRWSSKPWSAQFFYEHLTNSSYNTFNKTLKTCWCTPQNFLYFKSYSNITKTWSKAKQNAYADYVKDIQDFRDDFCQIVCGNILVDHAALSHHIEKTLLWLNDMDHYRSLFKINEFINRSLRLWMYNKSELVQNMTYLRYHTPLNSSCARYRHADQMYSPEYFLNDYFQRLKEAYPVAQHNLLWTHDPLLADYYIIPHDYVCMAIDHYRPTLTQLEYRNYYRRVNQNYFLPLLINIRTLFPYWNMSLGSNHIISFTIGKNMGVVQEDQILSLLKNVIQLGFTGFRQDLFPLNSSPLYVHRNITAIYRHNYDIIIPPFNRLQSINNKLPITNLSSKQWYQLKKNLLFFVGTINNSKSTDSVRHRLSLLVKKDIGKGKRYENDIIIDKKQFHTIVFIDGQISAVDYIENIRSSIFNLCPEGFSPWSPRLYESINLGTIPLILAESIVLPFERFIDWRSFSTKRNVNELENLIDSIRRIHRFEDYVKQKLNNATKYFYAFRWPYSPINQHSDRHVFLSEEDRNGTVKNVFHYLALELRCRRLEQFYGLNFDSLSKKSINARDQTCRKHRTICPCYEQEKILASEQYL